MSDWRSLFPAPAGAGDTWSVEQRVLRRGGHDFLLLPTRAHLAARTLALYPAQTPRARAARWLLGLGLELHLPMPLARVGLEISASSGLAQFLEKVAGTPRPAFGLLCGNPRSAAQRFVIVVFDAAGEAVGAVKAATSSEGRALIQREANFLEAHPSLPGAPSGRGRFSSPETDAFALDFVRGFSPQTDDIGGLARIVSAWIDSRRMVALSAIPAWRNVASHSQLSSLGKQCVHPVIFHGDLAPWNVRVDRGQWTVLDWERGEEIGVPAWDWFHFELQHAILVRRLATRELVVLAKIILARPEFQRYAEATGAAGCAGALLLAYLYHAAEVLQPTEGLESLRALRRAWEETLPRG